MQQSTVQMEDARLSVPDGGIASFVSDDDEIEDAKEFGSDGIAQFPALAQRMAAMGRGGDNTLAHVQTGELIIPAALLAQDPALKEGLFQRMRDMGIEYPERYVVGSEDNSLNPETGIPEFFVKKLFKGLVKVVKKVARVVLPIALAFTPLGPIYGAALGSGIATLINGGSFKDAIKSAAITGLTAGVFQGFTGGQGGFGANVQSALTDPIGRLGQTVTGLGSTVTGGGLTGAGNLFTPYVAPGGANITAAISSRGTPEAPATSGGGAPAAPATSGGGAPAAPATSGGGAPADVSALGRPPGFGESIKAAFTPNDGISFGEGITNAFFPKSTLTVGGQTLTNPTVSQVLQATGISPATATAGQRAAAQSMIAEAAPSFFRTYAPLAAAGLGVAGASGMFKPVPGEDPGLVEYGEEGKPITGSDLIAKTPGQYLIGDLGSRVLNPETGQYEDRAVAPIGAIGDLNPMYQMPASYSVPTTFPTPPFLRSSTPGGPFARPYVVQAAEGGAIFPRRNGGIMPNEGIPGKDSVRAMLMPGEFVMTTDAVRGLGNGNLNNGIKDMYSVMRNLESRGRARA
jgi:hypothetical protein